MVHLTRLVLMAALAAAACAGADSTGATTGTATPAALGATEALDAYDVNVVMNGAKQQFVLLLGKGRLSMMDTKAPESLVDSDQPGPSSPRWMPCTRDKDNSFTTSLDGMILHGTFSHGQLTGSVIGPGTAMAFTGTHSSKHYHIVRPLDRTQTLAQANALQSGHNPTKALELYQKLIDDDRFDSQVAGQALVGLVDCLEALHADAATATQGQALLARYLSAPPPLDGAHTVSLDTAEEDLLWKPWPPATGGTAGPLITFSISSAERKRQWQKGVPSDSVILTVAGEVPAQMRFAQDAHHADIGGRFPCAITATLADGSTQAPTQSYGYAIGGTSIQIQLTFDNVPAATTSIASLAGTVTVTQAKECEDMHIPFKDGQTWEAAGVSCHLTHVSGSDGQWSVTVVKTATRADAAANARVQAGMGAGDSEFVLVDANGVKLQARGLSSSGDGATLTTTLNFAGTSAPIELVHHLITKTSTHEVPFSLAKVELP